MYRIEVPELREERMHSCIAGRAQTLGNSGLGCLRAPFSEGQVSGGVARAQFG